MEKHLFWVIEHKECLIKINRKYKVVLSIVIKFSTFSKGKVIPNLKVNEKNIRLPCIFHNGAFYWPEYTFKI